MAELLYNPKALGKFKDQSGKTKEEILRDLLVKYGFHISRPTWDSWVNGEVVPRADDLGVLATYFGVAVQEFFGNHKK